MPSDIVPVFQKVWVLHAFAALAEFKSSLNYQLLPSTLTPPGSLMINYDLLPPVYDKTRTQSTVHSP